MEHIIQMSEALWVLVGLLIGAPIGFLVCSLFTAGKISDFESEAVHQKFVRDSLKEEIFRLDNQVKPKPRKKRNLRAKSIKIGK